MKNNITKLLILEDNPDDIHIIKTFLEQAGYSFDIKDAANRKDFFHVLETFFPEVILSNHSFLQFTATEALTISRQHIPNVPFILVTDTVSEEFAASIIKAGADDYMVKGRLTRLPAAIDAALKKRRAKKDKTEVEKRLIKSEEQYRTMMERVSDAFVAVDKNWCYTYINKTAGEMMQHDPAAIMGQHVWSLFPESIGKPIYVACHKAMQEQQFIRLEEYYAPFERWFENYVYPSQEGLSIFFRDITDNKTAAANLKLLEHEIHEQRVQEQKKTARAIILALEKERNHIAQELHDNITQILMGSKLHLGSAVNKHEEIKDLVKYPMELIDTSIEEIRLLCSNMVTPVKNINLKEQVQVLVNGLDQNATIQTSFSYTVGPIPIPDDLKLNIYRIMQELVSNILKYAEASNVTVWITTMDSSMEIGVVDDGKGFDITKKRKGIGISNIINRIDSFNGTIQISSSVGNGCSTTIRIPC